MEKKDQVLLDVTQLPKEFSNITKENWLEWSRQMNIVMHPATPDESFRLEILDVGSKEIKKGPKLKLIL